MWKWLGLVLTWLVIILCVITLVEVRENSKRLERILAKQENIAENVALISTYIKRVVITVPLNTEEDKK